MVRNLPIYNKIDYKLLNFFLFSVKERANIHTKKIHAIFSEWNIKVKIQSPFENIMPDFNTVTHIDEILFLLVPCTRGT